MQAKSQERDKGRDQNLPHQLGLGFDIYKIIQQSYRKQERRAQPDDGSY